MTRPPKPVTVTVPLRLDGLADRIGATFDAHQSRRLRDRTDTDEESETLCACGAWLPSLSEWKDHRNEAVVVQLILSAVTR